LMSPVVHEVHFLSFLFELEVIVDSGEEQP